MRYPNFGVLGIFASLVLSSGCATIPHDYPRDASYAITDTADTSLGRDVAAWNAINNGVSGFYPLRSGADAFAARLRLIEGAERSIDAQYFLMKDDMAGHVFANSLLQAADRGVRIRFLLDDIFSTVTDEQLFILDRHQNIEVRLYNPTARRGVTALNFLGDFERANRRMHNKSFTADNVVTVVGGRNIADEYFGISEDTDFTDFDVLAVGDVAGAVARTFDRSWNSALSLPLAALDVEFPDDQLGATREQIATEYASASATIYAEAMSNALVSRLFDAEIELYAASWELLADDPSKLETPVSEDAQELVNRLSEIGLRATDEIIVLSPYFVPLDSGIDYWRKITDKGVRVIIITNSLRSTNHIAVHSAYAKYRKPMLELGAELYEARAAATSIDKQSPSEATLHAKGIIIDRQRVFVGSLNLDPRSIDLNSEMGVVIESAELAGSLASDIMQDIDDWTYQVTIDDDGKLKWQGSIDGRKVTETGEPESSGWLKFKAWVLNIVPDSQL